jgi:hypothetical protein
MRPTSKIHPVAVQSVQEPSLSIRHGVRWIWMRPPFASNPARWGTAAPCGQTTAAVELPCTPTLEARWRPPGARESRHRHRRHPDAHPDAIPRRNTHSCVPTAGRPSCHAAPPTAVIARCWKARAAAARGRRPPRSPPPVHRRRPCGRVCQRTPHEALLASGGFGPRSIAGMQT